MSAETLLGVAVLVAVMKGQRLQYLFRASRSRLSVCVAGVELVTIGRFASDLWLTKDRRWRK